MPRCLTRFALPAALTLTAVLGFASSASASYHDNRIREVHETGINGDYVVLQAFSPGQNLVSGRQVVTYDGGGNPLSHVVLSNVQNASNQATILVGDDGVPGADATDPGFNVVNTGGAVCFAEGTSIATDPTGIDCIAYIGTMLTGFPAVPPASPYGTPFSLGGPNFDGQSIVRSIGRGCGTLLEPADDTNNSAADFAFGAPLARNNAAPITETACPPTAATPTTPAKKRKKCKKAKKKKSGGGAYAAKKKKCKKKKAG
jgi:hypothetical protein